MTQEIQDSESRTTQTADETEKTHSDAVSATDETAQPLKAQRKKSKLRWLWCFCILLFVIIATPVLFLLSGNGQRTALNWAAELIDGLEIEQVEGSLQEGLTLHRAAYKMDGVNVNVGQAQLHIGFDCLRDSKACVENIALKDTSVVIDTAKLPPSKTKEERERGEFKLPLGVALKQFSADNLNVRVDDMDIHLAHFHSAIEGNEKQLSLSPTELNGLTLSLAPQAVENQKEVAKKAAEKAVKGIDWAKLKQQLSKPLLTKLDPIKLPFDLDIADFQAKDIRIEQKVKNAEGNWGKPVSLVNVSKLVLKGQSDSEKIQLSTFEIQSDKGNVSGKGEVMLSGNYPLNLQLKGSHPEFSELKIPASHADVVIKGELFGKTALNMKSSGAAKFDLNGTVQLSEAKTPFNLNLKSDLLRYPFMPENGVEPLQLKAVDIALSGDLLNYRLNGSLQSSGMKLPSGSLQVKGKGELTQFELDELVLNALDGKANLSGSVDWANGVEWDSAVKLNSVNTKTLLPEWAAVLSGELHSKGFAARGQNGKEWQVAVNKMDINGTLFDKKLRLTGDLTADTQTLLNVQGANLIYGENVIGLKGVLGEKSDFNADIQAPNLKGLVPNLSAGIRGKVKMQGKLTEPSLDLDLTANNVAYQQIKLQGLTAKGKITTEREIVADLNLGLNQFSSGDIRVESANLSVQGTERNHTLKLTSKGDPIGGNLQISGKFDRLQQVWQGQLSNVSVQSAFGAIQNDKTVNVSYTHKQIKATLSPHCWRHSKLNLCFPQQFQAGEEGKVPFEIKQFDLATVQEYLDSTTQLSGVVNAKGDAAWFKNRAPQVNVELLSNGIKVNQKMDGRTFPLSFSPVKITAAMADNALKVNADVKVENNGRLTSDITLKDLAGKRALSGNIHIDKLNLSLIKPLLSGGESVDGDINARLTVGGTVTSPLLYGNLNLTGLKATSNAMPFDVIGGGLTMQFNGASSTLKGNIRTKESDLNLTGDANWQRLDAWHTRIQANANKFRVDVPGIAKVDVSPNIEVKATPRELILGGNIDIPWARIEVQELPESAVSVSGDEVIMDGSAKHKKALPPILSSKNAPQNGQGIAIKGDVSINIGNDVRIEAYGLKSELQGLIKVRQGNKGLGLYGQVNLKNGTFASFGQDLLIRKGVISFTGLPSQPTLDIEAIRNPEAMETQNVTAGVKVTGLADNLDVKVFSSPAMSQDQALSYILTGRGLESSGDAASSNSVAAALIGMSLSKGSKTVGKVGSAFGISDLNVSTAGIGDNTKVVVSGSLTPKFKVKYGVGIFAPLTELTLRYRLAPSLYLQWVSSINQAVDLLYRFEFD